MDELCTYATRKKMLAKYFVTIFHANKFRSILQNIQLITSDRTHSTTARSIYCDPKRKKKVKRIQ